MVRRGIDHFIESLGRLEGIRDLAMTTNAALLEERAPFLKEAGLNRINISLDSLNPETFHRVSCGDFDRVWRGFLAALVQGFKVKINAVLMKGINDGEIADLVDLTRKYPVDVRFIELMPIGATADFARAHFLSTDEVLKRVPLVELDIQDRHSTAKMYRLKDGIGRVGLIQPLSHHFCADCNRMRLTADGKLKPCLHSDFTIDLREALRAGRDIDPLIDQAIGGKPKQHRLLEGKGTTASMYTIGG